MCLSGRPGVSAAAFSRGNVLIINFLMIPKYDGVGQYWQVADGPSSTLTIDTDDIPLGSYNMDIVIYHYRSKEKFIPMGYASTQFSITGDQFTFIPVLIYCCF